MKIKKIEQICKEAEQFHLWDELPEMEDDGAAAPVQR